MTTTRRRSALVLAGLTALAVAACGGPSTTATPAGTGPGLAPTASSGSGAATMAPGAGVSIAEPCSLLTAGDIEQATGFKPTRQSPTTDPGDLPVGCEWELDNPGETAWAIVIGIRSPGGREVSLHAGTQIDGLGDTAVQVDAAVVEAIKGDTLVSVTYIEFPERPAVPVELARLILAKV